MGSMRWHPPSCRVAHLGSEAPSTSPPLAAKGQCHTRVASTRGHHSSHSLRRLLLHMHVLLAWCVRALAAKVEPSCPSHPPSAHTAIKGCRCFRPYFHDRLTVTRPNQSPPFFLSMSQSTHPPRSSFPGRGQFPTTTRAHLPRFEHPPTFVARLPHFELGLSTVSGECTMG
jgi:hypothetical protein